MIDRASRVALAVLVLAACGRRHDPPAAPGSAQPVATAPVDTRPASPFPLVAPELITGVIDDWTSQTVTLAEWRRQGSGWVAQGLTWDGVIGKAGAAWGDGLHGSGAPAGRSGPVKHEGDKASPAGAFLLRGIYGYASGAVSSLTYTPTTRDWLCIDDPASAHYGEIADRTKLAGSDWSHAEQMYRDDDEYLWVIDIAHNPSRRPGGGSCIFLHMMSEPLKPTVGCTAMTEPHISRLISELEPGAVYVLLPRAEYAALQTAWGLPRL